MTSKGTIFDIKRFAVHDGPGIRTTVFLKGCPLTCAWCHNPESRKREPEPAGGLSPRLPHEFGANAGVIGASAEAEAILEQVLLDRVFFEESGGGMTLSGGEPLLQPEFAETLLTLASESGVHTAVDTCGAVAWGAIERVLAVTDLFLYDIKILDPQDHLRWVGASVDPVRSNLERLIQTGATVRMRIALIPGATDSDENLEAAARFAESLHGLQGVDLLPYNPAGEHKYSRLGIPLRAGHHASQDAVALQRAAAFFEQRAVPVSIGGSP